MDLDFDDATLAFQAEVRDFLAANRESFPTKSYDTAEGFEQHRRWDKVLFDAGLSVITWPEKYGGRDATPAAVGGLRGGVLPRRRAGPGQRQRHFDARADAVRPRHRGTAGPGAAEDGQRRGDLGAGVVGAGVGQRPGVAAIDGDQDRWRLAAQRPEDLEFAGAVRGAGIRVVPLRSRGRASPWPDLLHVRPEGRRRHRPADRATRRRHRFRRDLPRRRVRPRRRRDRRGARRLARRDEHVEQRARHVAAQPRPLPRAGRTTGRSSGKPIPIPSSPTGWPTPGSRRRPTGCTRSAP